jgi:acetoin:2,6-dichlorophenolindophenol oxidoreductase subunit alpha
MTVANDMLLEMRRRMLRIRRFDERASKMVKRGEIPGTVHTSIGQEPQVVGATMALADGDCMTGNRRSHGHPIGKGAALGPLMAELVGKAWGVCGGKGGSMHLADFKVGSLGKSGIVGSSIPIATGAALSSKVLGNGRVSLAFFGDGAANQGCLYEAMNLASVWKLPMQCAKPLARNHEDFDMPWANPRKLIDDTRKGKYAVGVFNMHNDETTEALVRAAEQAKSPVI